MASSMFWKGYLRLSNVTCAIAMVPATPNVENRFFTTDEDEDPDQPDARIIDIEAFVTKSSTDWRQYDKAHFMVPDDLSGETAFADIRQIMEKTGTVAICNIALGRRELSAMLEPRETGIVLWTLRPDDEAPALFFPGYKAPKPASNLVSLFG